MIGLELVQDLAIVMMVSAVTTLACNALRLPAVLGYIIAGIIIGPHTPPFSLIQDEKNIETIANLGVIFLMFSIGLEFNLDKLRKLGVTALIATTLEVLLMIWIGYSLGKLLGWQLMDCLFLGVILCVSSTTIIAAVLIELKLLKELFAQISIAILIVEDLVAVLIIAILSALAISGTVTLENVSFAFIKVLLFMVISIVVGLMTIPKTIDFISRRGSHEVLIVAMLGMCFGLSVLGAKLGFSVALGAFLVGAVMGESKNVEVLIQKVEPLRDMFMALFFVSVGMILEPVILVKYWLPVLLITATMVIGKYCVVSFGVFLSGHNAKNAMKVALSMVQIGEFSFIMAQLGESAGVIRQPLFSIAVSVSLISSFLTPFFIRYSDQIAGVLVQFVPKRLATFGGYYTSWIGTISHEVKKEKPEITVKRATTNIIPVLIYTFLIGGLFYMGYQFSPRGFAEISRFIFNPGIASFLYWLAVGCIIFPFWVGLVYSLDKLLWNVFFGESRITHELEENKAGIPRKLIRIMFRAGIFFALSLLALSVSSPFLPNIPILLIIGGGLSLMSFWFWALVTRFQSHLEDTVKMVFEKEEPGAKKAEQEKARHELEELIKREYPWEVLTEDVIVPYKQTAVNQPIRDLKLPQITGAMIMAIYRVEGTMVNPSPHTIIMPGDVLVVMGEQEQIQNSIRYLSELMSKAPVLVAQDKPLALKISIEEISPAVGKTIAELGLRAKTSVSVIGLQRADGSSITNPPPNTQILAGDTVILFGTEEQIENARLILLG